LQVPPLGRLHSGGYNADIVLRVLFSFSTFFHVLGRDQDGPSRASSSICRRRTRLSVVTRFLGKKLERAFSVYAIPNSVSSIPVQVSSYHCRVVCIRARQNRTRT